MWLERLGLVNFRNLVKQELTLDKKINLFIGDNAQGKTNIIEAINLLTTTKSFRTSNERELIRWGTESATVDGVAGSNEIKIIITRDTKKALVNRRVRNKSAIVGILPSVLFSPESLNIASGPPEKRRRFLDQALSVVDKNYLFALSRYLKIIKTRNKLLWLIKQGRKQDLSVWNKQLSDLASFIWSQRISFVDRANPSLKGVGQRLVGSQIRLSYIPFSAKIKDNKDIAKRIEVELVKREDSDIEVGTTSIGPHRDDFRILFEIIGKEKILEKDIGTFGSRGEQRIATLALKLIEVEFIEESLGERPTLLLDDVLSEFDKKNREQIIMTLPKQQSVITTTSTDFFPKDILKSVKIFQVSEGKVKKFEGKSN